MDNNEEFLGDGLYASFDGWHIALRAPRTDGDHVVYLELGKGGTLEKFTAYAHRCLDMLDARKTQAEKAQSRIADAKEGFSDVDG